MLFICVALAAQLAAAIALEEIVGAFMVGLAIKAAVRDQPLDHTLEIISQALFIPAFFIATGFLTDLVAFQGTVRAHPMLAVGIVVALGGGKFAAAVVAARAFGYTNVEQRLMWGLSLPQVAATLAAAVAAYRTVNSAGVRLLDGVLLNAILVLVVLSSVTGPLLTERYGRALVTEARDGA